jgi:hypothetical protein
MGQDRGLLARIDRKLLAGLGQDEAFHMVRVPATEAKWSTWKRYCGAAGISMGRAISVLVDRELVGVFGEPTTNEVPVFARQAQTELTDRELRLDVRERKVEAAEARLRAWDGRLRIEEERLGVVAQRIERASRQLPRPRQVAPKIGRNDRCPCGSDLKYKQCHGLAGGSVR